MRWRRTAFSEKRGSIPHGSGVRGAFTAHSSSERHSALRMPRQAQGAGAKAATYAQLSKQPVPAPSRDLSHWSSTSQLGSAEPCAGLGWPSWHQPHVGKNSLMRNSRTPQIPQELPKGWWLAVCSYICRSAIEPFSN